MSGISPLSTANTINPTNTRLQATTPNARAAAEPTGYAARISQLGPTIGTVVATGELLSDAASATYTVASQKLHQLGNAASQAVATTEHALESLEDSASEAWTDASQAVEDAAHTAADTVSHAASAVAKAFEQGASTVGRWINEAV